MLEPAFLRDGGDCGARLRALDWSASSLGEPETWPRSLSALVQLILQAKQPMFVAWGDDLVFLYNDAYAEILGRKHPGLGRPFADLWADIWPQFGPIVARVLSGEPAWFQDLPITMERNGGPEETWFSFSYTPARDEDGGVRGLFCACSETTASVLAQREREVAQAATDALIAQRTATLSQLLEGVIVTDASGRITFVNEAAVRLHGVERLDVPPEDYSASYGLFTEDGRPYPPEQLPLARAVLNGETIQDARWRIRRPDGSEVLAIGNARPFGDGAPEGAVLTLRDDTARKAAEEALRISEERARAVIDGAHDHAIFTTDAEGTILSWSEGAAAIFGWSEAEAVGRPGALIFTPEDRANGAHALELATAVEEGCAEDERWHLRKDGSRVFMNGSMRPLTGPDGALRGFLKIARDETDRRLAADRAAADELEFRTVADHSPAIMWVTDPEGNCTYLNRPWFEFTGQSPQEAAGLGWLDATHPDDKGPSGETFLAANAARTPFQLEYRLQSAEGGYRWCIDAGRPRFGDDGSFLGFVGAVVDIDDRKRAEATSSESEARFRAITNTIDQMIWSTQADGFHDFYNQRWYDYTGVPEGSTDGEAWNDVFHPEDQPRAWALWRRSLETGEPYEIEYRLRHRSGEYRWVLGRALAMRGDAGEIVRWFGTCTDIHDHKATEAALAEREAELRLITNVLPVLIAYVDGDQRYRFVNEAYKTWFGYELSEVLGKTVREVVGDAAYEKARPSVERALAGEGFSFETVLPYREGGERHIRATYLPRRDGERVLGYFAMVQDIGEQKRVEAALRESEADYRSAAELNPQVAWTAQPDGQLDRVASRWREWTGVSGLGETWGQSLHPDDLAHSVEAWTRSVTTGVPYDVEHRVMRTDGQVRWARSRAFPRIEEDRIVRWYGATEDIHERKVAELALQSLNARLESEVETRTRELRATEESLRQAQKMESIGQLTGGIAHDFNNLLTGIIGSLDLVRRRLRDGRTDGLDRYMDAASTSAQRAAALTHRLLAFARRQSLDLRPTDVNGLIASMEDLLRRTLGERIELTVALKDDLWPAMADANQLESALLNLAINARDAMPEGGRLTVTTGHVTVETVDTTLEEPPQPGDYVAISVSDTGPGMTTEVAARAFEPFYTTKPLGQGTGLGLSMIYGFAKQAGGNVRIFSEEGRGVTVRLKLPRADVEPLSAVAGPAAERLAPGAGETVLVVEDDAAVRMLVVDLLTELGYRVLQAHDGPAALPILEGGEAIDLLVTDVGLPGLDGRRVAQRARERRPCLPVVFMTGYAQEAALRSGFLDPGMDLITKPFAAEALAAKVAVALGRTASA